MLVEDLIWDSDFFGIDIAKIILFDDYFVENEFVKLLIDCRVKKKLLIYCLTNQSTIINSTVLKEFCGRLVDQKVVYVGDISSDYFSVDCIEEYDSLNATKELENLAYRSGEFSRYKVDTHFTDSEFKRLYKAWIDNSLTKQLADKVFVAKDMGKIVGMITVKIKNDHGEIGLLAVDDMVQGKGYGRKLINSVRNFLIEHNVKKIEVSTQLANSQACAFYASCGLKIKTTHNFYHFWI